MFPQLPSPEGSIETRTDPQSSTGDPDERVEGEGGVILQDVVKDTRESEVTEQDEPRVSCWRVGSG